MSVTTIPIYATKHPSNPSAVRVHMGDFMRVYEIAIELRVESREVRAVLLDTFGIDVKSASGRVERLFAETFIARYRGR